MSETNKSSQGDTSKGTGQSRYLTSEKKRYLLASVDEDEQSLMNQQKQELTNILIELKSEYDKITRESKCKNEQIIELEKMSKMLEEMDQKNQKKYKEVAETNEVMEQAIDLKKKKKEEELYQKKTLQKQIEKLKTDILLIQKEIITKEIQYKRLEKQYELERINENEIRLKKNNKYMQIETQKDKNKYEQNEHDLQIGYYKKIIEQKSRFLKAADERKQKQAEIARNAKNDSLDKTEVEMRKALELNKLYHQYLNHKMKTQLEENADLEKAYREVKDICVKY
ncbi:MAG: hypothetical protein MJ252_20020 [archaeon]|nr:hypothetical protein [archaeon]